jgi:hypothetical protein
MHLKFIITFLRGAQTKKSDFGAIYNFLYFMFWSPSFDPRSWGLVTSKAQNTKIFCIVRSNFEQQTSPLSNQKQPK